MSESVKLTKEIFDTFGDAFSGVGCFKGTFLLHVKEDENHYQAQPSQVCSKSNSERKWSDLTSNK